MFDTNVKKRPLAKYIALGIGFVIISILILNTLLIAAAGVFTARPAPVTILYDPTDAILTTTATSIQNYLAGFTIVKMIPVFQVGSLLTLIDRISNPIVYVFHGNTAGWKVGNAFITNNILSSAIQKSPSPAHFFVACDSNILAQVIPNKYLGNLFGITDAQVGAVLIEEQVLSYYSTHGLTQQQYTQSNADLQTYIRNNGMNLFSRFLHPVQPLICPNSISPNLISPLYYYGPSGFYVTSSSTNPQNIAGTALVAAVAAINSLVNDLNDLPGLTITINAEYHAINGNAVYSYEAAGSCGSLIWYSVVDPVSFNYMSISASVAYVSPSGDPDTEASSYSVSISGFTAGIDISPGSPSLETGGTLGYATPVTFTQSATDSNCQYYVNQWIADNVYPNVWQLSLYLQLVESYDAKAQISYSGQNYSLTLATLDLGGRVSFTTDSNGNIVAGGALFAKVTSSASVPFLVSFSIKLLLVGLGLQTQWSNGNFLSTIYSGVYFDASASVTGISADLPIIVTHAWYNSLGASTDTLISNLASTEFGG